MSSTSTLKEVAQALLDADDLVICGHVSPDGDCLSSTLALGRALHSLGKSVVCLTARNDTIDRGLKFLPGMGDMVSATVFSAPFKTFVTVDVPNAGRMGEDAAALHARAERTVTIDHHINEEPLSDVNYVDSQAPATALIIWKLIELLGVEPDREIATCCYTGLMTDTGRFQYQNTTAEALHAAASMVDAGANPADIAREVYQNRSRASLSLEARMLANATFVNNGAFAIGYLKRSDFVESGAVKSDAEPLIDVLRSVCGVRVAVMLRQMEEGVRGSLRAKDDTDVAQIARVFGGGGHRAAAGFTFSGSLSDCRRAVIKQLESVDQE